MLTVELLRRAVLLLLLALAPAAALAQARESTLVRLSDAIGDTIDLAERDSFHLFPNTAGFQHAVIIALPGPEFYAKVMLATPSTLGHAFFRVMPGDLQRMRFLVSNSGFVSEQQQSDSTAAKTLASFWQEIEEHPLRSIAGEPADTLSAAPSLPRESTAVESVRSANSENRYTYSLHGTTCGSIAGGCIGAWSGITYVRTEQPTDCGPAVQVYRFDPCLFWGAACGLTALGAGAGYAMGDRLDHERPAQMARLKESTGWRTGCAIGALVPGAVLGYYSFLALGLSMYGRVTDPFIRIEPDPGAVALLPAAVTSLCIVLESATLGYQLGRAIDRKKAEEAAARRRSLGR